MTPQLDRAGSSRHAQAWARGAVLGACALLAAACGSTPAAPASAGGSAGSPHGSAAKVSLDVSFTAAAGRPARHWTLRCEPAGGSYPDPAAACAGLAAAPDLFAPPPSHSACPMIMAGAQQVLVTGSYHGRHIHQVIVDGGCDLSRFDKISQIFP